MFLFVLVFFAHGILLKWKGVSLEDVFKDYHMQLRAKRKAAKEKAKQELGRAGQPMC